MRQVWSLRRGDPYEGYWTQRMYDSEAKATKALQRRRSRQVVVPEDFYSQFYEKYPHDHSKNYGESLSFRLGRMKDSIWYHNHIYNNKFLEAKITDYDDYIVTKEVVY